MAQQGSRFTVEELREIIADPRFTDDHLSRFNEQERAAVDRLRAAAVRTEPPVQGTGFESYESPSLSELGQAFMNLGGAETLGGLGAGAAAGAAFGPAGIIPGAMIGAGGTSYLRGGSPGEVAMNAGAEAVPLVGKAMTAVGRRAIGYSIPKIERILKQFGGAQGLEAGLQRLISEIVDLPGLRLGPMKDRQFKRMAALEPEIEQGIKGAGDPWVDMAPVIAEGQAHLGGPVHRRIGATAPKEAAKDVLQNFSDIRHTPVPSSQVRADLADSKFITTDSFGADEMGQVLREAMSEELKTAVPAIRKSFAEYSKGIPVREVLDKAAVGTFEASPPIPRAIATKAGAHLFGSVPPGRKTMFAGGQALAKGGRPMQSPFAPGILRTILEAILGDAIPMEQETPERRQVGAP